mmetsp:Transcript_16757/g.29350  ORF Transcript_16757/g.29350 Transcript_16757/m.29350 type:complete len:196 (+) Transcript_16757:92-679(+)
MSAVTSFFIPSPSVFKTIPAPLANSNLCSRTPKPRLPNRAFIAMATDHKKYIQAIFDHVALSTSDVVKSGEFYETILGLEPIRIDEFKKGQVPFPSYRLNANTIIDLFPVSKDKSVVSSTNTNASLEPNANHICIALSKSDFDVLVDRAQKAGVTFDFPLPPKARFGARGTGYSVYLRDPDNNSVELRYYPDSQN